MKKTDWNLNIPSALQLALRHQANGELQQAESICQQVLRVDPKNADALYLMGIIAYQVGRSDTAVELIRKAIDKNPNNASAHGNLSNILMDLGRFAEAVASYQQAIVLRPDFAEAHYNLGNALRDLGQLAEATASYRQAIDLKPDFAEAHSNLGNALSDLGRLAEAAASYRHAIALRPDYTKAYSNLLFNLNYEVELSPLVSLKEAKRFGELLSKKVVNKYTGWDCSFSSNKLRIGFVSGDFRNHPVGYFIEGLLLNIDKSKYELTVSLCGELMIVD